MHYQVNRSSAADKRSYQDGRRIRAKHGVNPRLARFTMTTEIATWNGIHQVTSSSLVGLIGGTRPDIAWIALIKKSRPISRIYREITFVVIIGTDAAARAGALRVGIQAGIDVRILRVGRHVPLDRLTGEGRLATDGQGVYHWGCRRMVSVT